MAIAEHVKSLQDSFDACQIAAYVDLSAKMVLSSASRATVPQEKLDSMCNAASDVLTGAASGAVASVLAGEADASLQSAVIVIGDSIHIVQRSFDDPDEALCCLCDATVDVGEIMSAGVAHVKAIGAET